MRTPPATLHLAFRIRRVFSSPMKSLKINCPVRSSFLWKKDPAPITNHQAQNPVDRWLPELSPSGKRMLVVAIQKSATEWLVVFYSSPRAWPEATALPCAMVQEGHTASPDPALLDAVKGNGEDLGGVGASRGKRV